MTCSARIAEVVESARRGLPAGRALRAHLAQCGDCERRWNAERQLSAHLQTIRVRTAGLRSSETQRESLMQHLATITRESRRRRVWSLAWAFSAAAAMLIAAFLGREVGSRMIWNHPVKSGISQRRSSQTLVREASADASALSSDDFIAVPYTPPLAPGEMVRVIHADLFPEALAGMGIDVDPAWASNLPADVVVGEDGFPRAVRITENNQF
jgi:hypothetical protein